MQKCSLICEHKTWKQKHISWVTVTGDSVARTRFLPWWRSTRWSLPLCTSPPTPWSLETEPDRNTGPESHAPEENGSDQIIILSTQTWHTHASERNLTEIASCSSGHGPHMSSCLVTLTATADKAPLALSAVRHNESVLWCEEWAIMAAWLWGCSVRVRHLPADFSLRAAPGWRRGPARLPRHIKSPVSSHLHRTFWLLSSPQSVTKAQKYIMRTC